MSVKLTVAKLKNLEGAWLQKGDDDIHVHTADLELSKPGVEIGYNVNQCRDDKASRLALSLTSDGAILQIVDPETKQVRQVSVPADVVYDELLAVLNRLAAGR